MTEPSTLVTTTTPSSQRPQPAPEGPRRPTRTRWPKGRDESGLTTLEWLLIVAAVAGLAALAVVLVQNVVGDTAEQIAGSSARRTAASLAADSIVRDAGDDVDDQPTDAKTWDDWADFYESKCERLSLTYGDAGITVHPNFTYLAALSSDSAVVPGSILSVAQSETSDIGATRAAGRDAVAQCRLS